MNGLKDKVAFVTGGASGIRAAACRRFTQEGAYVAIGGIDGDRAQGLAKEIGKNAIGVRFDAGDSTQVENLVSRTVERFGRLDFLFNNAAIMSHEIVVTDTNPVDIAFDTWDLVQRLGTNQSLATR